MERVTVIVIMSLLIGVFITVMPTAFFPPLAKVPGLVLCDGEFTLHYRRDTSVGVCINREAERTTTVDFVVFTAVGTLVWAGISLLPVSLAVFRLTRKG